MYVLLQNLGKKIFSLPFFNSYFVPSKNRHVVLFQALPSNVSHFVFICIEIKSLHIHSSVLQMPYNGGLCPGQKPTELAHSFYSVLVSVSVFMAFSIVFHSINSPDNSPLSHSVLPVLFLPYWSFKLYIYL